MTPPWLRWYVSKLRFGEQGVRHVCTPCIDELRSLLVLSLLACCITSPSICVYHILIYHYQTVSEFVWVLPSLSGHLQSSQGPLLFTSPCHLRKCAGCRLLTSKLVANLGSASGANSFSQLPQQALLSHVQPEAFSLCQGSIMWGSCALTVPDSVPALLVSLCTAGQICPRPATSYGTRVPVSALQNNRHLLASKTSRDGGSQNSRQPAHVTHLIFLLERLRSLLSLSASPQILLQFLLSFVQFPWKSWATELLRNRGTFLLAHRSLRW